MGIKEIKQEQQLFYLRRLLNIRVKLTKYVKSVDVITKSDVLIIRWNINEDDRYFDFEEKEVPIKDLGKIIQYYKRKVRTEFKNRHEK